MAGRALLRNIELARSRVPKQPSPESEKDRTYREVLQDISATLGLVGQGVNLARATEPWWASAGYDGNPEAQAAIDRKASELSRQLGAAYAQQAPQQPMQPQVATVPPPPPPPQQAQQAQPSGPTMEQAPRMGSSMMSRQDRRGAVEGLPLSAQTFKPSVAEPEQPRFNRIEGQKREKMFVRNDAAAIRGGSGPLRQEWDETSVPVSTAQAQRLAFGDPLTSFPTEQAAIEAANQLRFDQTMARRRGWDIARQSAEQNVAAGKQPQTAAAPAAERAPQPLIAPESYRLSPDASMEGMGAFQQQAPQAAPVAEAPPPPPADPAQRQRELKDVAAETLAPAAAVAAEIDRFSSVPVFETYAEAKAAMAQAVMTGDVEAADAILKGAQRSRLKDVQPLTLADRLSGAHVRRAMDDLTKMTGNLRRDNLMAAQAQARARWQERRLAVAEANAKSLATDRRLRQEREALKLELATRKADAQMRNIESQVWARGITTRLKADMHDTLKRLHVAQATNNYAQAARAGADAKRIRTLLPAAAAKAWFDVYSREAGAQADYEQAQEAGAQGLGERPTVGNVQDKLERGERLPAPGASKVESQKELARYKAELRAAQRATDRILGGGPAGKIAPEDAERARSIRSAIAKAAREKNVAGMSAKGVRSAETVLRGAVAKIENAALREAVQSEIDAARAVESKGATAKQAARKKAIDDIDIDLP